MSARLVVSAWSFLSFLAWGGLLWPTPASAGASQENQAIARMTVQMSAMESTLEETLRELRGKIEELQNEIRTVTEQQEKQASDGDTRFSALEQKTEALIQDLEAVKARKNSAKASPEKKKNRNPDEEESSPPEKKKNARSGKKAASQEPGADEPAESPPPSGAGELFKKARTAFDQGHYDEAQQLLDTLIARHPKNRNIHQALFYRGSVHYLEGRFSDASVDFIKAWKADSKGSKAQESLVKTAFCLEKLKKKKEACKVLAKLANSFDTLTPSVQKQSGQLGRKLGCSEGGS